MKNVEKKDVEDVEDVEGEEACRRLLPLF